MSPRLLRRVVYASFCSLAVMLALGPASPAHADGATLLQYGWWTEANYVNALNAPGTDKLPDNADMHVAIGPIVYDDPYSIQNDNKTGAIEVSAVRYQLPEALPDGVDPSTPVADLTLTIDSAHPPAGTVVLLACRTLEGWNPALAGNWNDRVYYQQGGCSVGFSSDGSTYHFGVLASQVSMGRTIDLAIAPTLDPNALPFSADLLPPTAADLDVLSLPLSASDLFSVPQPDTSAANAAATGSGYPAAAFAAAPPAAPLLPAPASAPPAAPAPQQQATTPPLVAAAAQPVVDTGARVLAGVLLVAVLLALLSATGLDMQRLLTPAGQMGGVGRFRRQRSGPPLPL